jgi:hypothetical protein
MRSSEVRIVRNCFEELRNGLIHVQPVTDANGAVLYSTKQAAFSGRVR